MISFWWIWENICMPESLSNVCHNKPDAHFFCLSNLHRGGNLKSCFSTHLLLRSIRSNIESTPQPHPPPTHSYWTICVESWGLPEEKFSWTNSTILLLSRNNWLNVRFLILYRAGSFYISGHWNVQFQDFLIFFCTSICTPIFACPRFLKSGHILKVFTLNWNLPKHFAWIGHLSKVFANDLPTLKYRKSMTWHHNIKHYFWPLSICL